MMNDFSLRDILKLHIAYVLSFILTRLLSRGFSKKMSTIHSILGDFNDSFMAELSTPLFWLKMSNYLHNEF